MFELVGHCHISVLFFLVKSHHASLPVLEMPIFYVILYSLLKSYCSHCSFHLSITVSLNAFLLCEFVCCEHEKWVALIRTVLTLLQLSKVKYNMFARTKQTLMRWKSSFIWSLVPLKRCLLCDSSEGQLCVCCFCTGCGLNDFCCK